MLQLLRDKLIFSNFLTSVKIIFYIIFPVANSRWRQNAQSMAFEAPNHNIIIVLHPTFSFQNCVLDLETLSARVQRKQDAEGGGLTSNYTWMSCFDLRFKVFCLQGGESVSFLLARTFKFVFSFIFLRIRVNRRPKSEHRTAMIRLYLMPLNKLRS